MLRDLPSIARSTKKNLGRRKKRNKNKKAIIEEEARVGRGKN